METLVLGAFGNLVITKVVKRLERWKRAFLSKGGRLTLIEFVLSAIPTYFLSLFRMSSRVIKEFEKIMHHFLWKGADGDGGDHLIAWKMVVRPKNKGGLGIGRLKENNKALLLKWFWRFPLEQDSIWTKVIKSKFDLQSNRWDAGFASRYTFCSPWKFISSLYAAFWELVRFKVGNGRRIRFWEDVWWDSEALSNHFTDLYRLSTSTNCTISELVVPQTDSSYHGWDLHFFRNLHDCKLENLADLTVVLDHLHLNEESADLRIWHPDNSGCFSSRSAFGALQQIDELQDFPFHGYIWKSGIPVRIKFFAWSLSLGRINIFDVLQRKRPFQCLSPNWCVMCKRDLESSRHLFLHYEFAKSLERVWSSFRNTG